MSLRTLRTHSQNIEFTRNLIKGKIAEIIFQEMAIDSGKCLVLPLGYEHTTPILAQYTRKNVDVKKALEDIRSAPDFALVEHGSDEVYFIEVKYRRNCTATNVLDIVTEMYESWPRAYLFLATKEGFYFGSIEDIAKENGMIKKIEKTHLLSYKDTKDYHKLLLEYEN